MFIPGSTGSEGSATARQRARRALREEPLSKPTDSAASCRHAVPPCSHRAWARHANPANILKALSEKLMMAIRNCQAACPDRREAAFINVISRLCGVRRARRYTPSIRDPWRALAGV